VTNKLKNAALTAFRLALRPLIRVMMRNGITWKEAAEVCKQTYVEVASKDYGVHGRPTNASRVAILTGLSRHEVKRVRDALSGDPEALQRMNAATRLLGGWHTDPAFCDAEGRPRPLPLNAEDGASSFAALCRRYAPDIPIMAMLKELQRVNGVATTGDEDFIPTARYYMPDSQDPDAVLRAGSVLEDLGNNLAFNLAQDTKAGDETRFEGRATNINIRASAAKEFRVYLEDEAQDFLERLDAWLAQHEKSPDRKSRERTLRLGVGIYQISDDNER
jgi:hypothetical protein